MPRVTRSTRGTTKKAHGPSTSHDVATPDNGNAQLRASSKETDMQIKKGLIPITESEGAGRFVGQQAPKARRLKAQEPATIATPTRTLPNRPGRNVHPAGLPKSRRSRRSKEQIEAEREAKKKALEEKARKERTAMERLVHVNLFEEREDDLPHQHPPRLSAMIQKRHHGDMETDSEECFDLREADHGSDSDLDMDIDSDPQSASLKAANTTTEPSGPTRGKKRVKGATRQELMVRTEELRRGAEHSTKRQKSQGDTGRFSAEDLRSRKYARSGLRPRSPSPLTAAQSQGDPFELGGLCDDDLEDSYPAIVETKGSQKRPSHGREPIKQVPKSKATKVAKAVTAKKHASNLEEETIIDVKPTARAYFDVAQECLNDPRWTRIYLHTLGHALYVSDSPFIDWAWKSGTLRRTVQAVFDISFTNISYAVTEEDVIMKAAYDRMRTRKSKIASDVLTLVKTFFNSAEFRNRPEKIRDYVRWALGTGGPAYYKNPVPVSCPLSRDDPDYPKPEGFLRSQFILPVAKGYMGLAARSVLHPALGPRSPPKGLYALILTAVERAMRAHLTGVFIAPDEFNHKTTWNSLRDFHRTLNRLREHHWEQILNYNDLDESENVADESMLSACRIDFYLPSSP